MILPRLSAHKNYEAENWQRAGYQCLVSQSFSFGCVMAFFFALAVPDMRDMGATWDNHQCLTRNGLLAWV